MALPSVNGQELYDELAVRIGGYSNAFTPDELLSFLNEGMNEVWKELKNLRRNYFIATTQATDNTLSTYFGALTTATRSYDLPDDLREIRSVTVTSPAGYEGVRFVRRDIASDDFLNAERDAAANLGNRLYAEYFYDIVDAHKLVIAQFPEVAFVLQIRYVYALPAIALDQVVAGILYPWHFKILDWAAKKALLAKQNESMVEEWRREWREGVLSIAASAGARDTATPQVVQGMYEDW